MEDNAITSTGLALSLEALRILSTLIPDEPGEAVQVVEGMRLALAEMDADGEDVTEVQAEFRSTVRGIIESFDETAEDDPLGTATLTPSEFQIFLMQLGLEMLS